MAAGWDLGAELCQDVGLRALGFVAGNGKALDRFLAETGLCRADLGRRPLSPQHLAAALDVLITDEPALQRFARIVNLPPEAAYEARRLLRGSPRRGAN